MDNPQVEYTALLVNSELDICTKLCKKIESMFRTSYEYHQMLAMLRTEECNNQDLLYDEYECGEGVTIEYHHPFRLYNIVKVAIKELLDEKKSNITTGEILDRVIAYHYQGIIPYVFLFSTTHQLHHDGQFDIDVKYIKGDYKKFLRTKRKYFDEEDKQMIKDNLKINVDEMDVD